MMSLPATTAGAPPNRRYLVWERSFIMGPSVLTAVGLVLVADLVADLLAVSDGAAMARAGAVAYLFGGILVVEAGASGLAQGPHQDWPEQSWLLAVVYVVLALLAQAAIGGALLAADVLPAWIGWATLAWNIRWLAFYLLRRGDIYIPFVHHVMPFASGSRCFSKTVNESGRSRQSASVKEGEGHDVSSWQPPKEVGESDGSAR